MSRLEKFSRNLATSYLQLAVTVIYSLVSIPLILYWLPKVEFGLWAVLVQLMGYVSIIDLGMTSAISRLLVDHKDERNNGNYGALVKTAFLVSCAQGLIILVAVILSAPLLTDLMKVPQEHQDTFILLLRIQGVITALGFSLRPFGLMLYAHQRLDLQSYSEIFNLATQLVLLFLFLINNYGIYSFIYANAITSLIIPIFLFWNCHRLGILPRAKEWGKASWQIFNEVFNYGKDVFLFNLGGQLQMASQTIIVSRALGLEQAALWAVGTKMFNLMIPLMIRPNGAALPSMYEMLARNELGQLKSRFKDIVLLTASLGGFLSISFGLCNHLFVELWTSGKIIWPPLNDVLLGVWLFILSMQTTHCCFVTVTKKIGAMHYILFLEGCSFIVLATIFGSHWGIPGMVAISIICTLMFSYQYSLRQSCVFFQCRLIEIAVTWIIPSLKLTVVFASIGLSVSFLDIRLPVIWRLIIHALVAAGIGGILFLRIGLPEKMIREVIFRLPQPVSRLLQFVVH